MLWLILIEIGKLRQQVKMHEKAVFKRNACYKVNIVGPYFVLRYGIY